MTPGTSDLQLGWTFYIQRLLCDHGIAAHARWKQIFDGEGHTCCEVENVFTTEIGECEETHVHKERSHPGGCDVMGTREYFGY